MAIDLESIEVLDVLEDRLNSVFPGEATAFTPWLARPENLARLSKAIGLELEALDTEVSTGVFRIDLLARNLVDDRVVIIENQFGRSDHDHLGKALTYLAATADSGEAMARTVIWLAERFADEHQAVLTWLNDNTPEDVGFWGVTPRVLRIGDGPPGLRFDVIVRPNTFVKATRSVTSEKAYDASVTKLRRAYWPIFKSLLDADPDLSDVKTRFGGSGGFIHLFPDERYLKLEIPVHVLAFISVSVGREQYAGVWMRPNPEQAPDLSDQIEIFREELNTRVSDMGMSLKTVGDFSTDEGRKQIAEKHLIVSKIALGVLAETFAGYATEFGEG
jgi:hypothetical protein